MVVGGSQRLLSLNPTTVMVVLLLGFWLLLLLGCDNIQLQSRQKVKLKFQSNLGLVENTETKIHNL